MLDIQDLKIPIDKNVFVGFAEAEYGGPILKNTAMDTDLCFGVDFSIAFVFALPRLRSRETGVFRIAPLDLSQKDVFRVY